MAAQCKFYRTQTLEIAYLLFLPRNYDAKSRKRWPLILFLHGAGERGTDIWKVAKHGPPKHTNENPSFPFIVVSPQCPEGQVWSNYNLLELMNGIISRYRVDPGRVYLTGLSMGGYGTWRLGLTHPEKFAAIAPVCGGGEMITVALSSSGKRSSLRSLAVWAFHGAEDPVVPVTESQRMADAVKKAGVQEVKLTIYPGIGHDSWTQTYENPRLYEWLLKHKRKTPRN
jgi:predicted peptidase